MSDEDFRELVQHKETIVSKGKGAITIHTDGSITIDTSKKPNYENSDSFYAYSTSKEAILNLNEDIEHYVPIIGEPFAKVLRATRDFLIENDVKNPRPYSIRTYRNNKTMRWHRHTMMPNIRRQNFFVALYYLHPNWDVSYGGDLKVGLAEDESILTVPCYSNSIVIHDGFYGHGVDHLKLGYEGDRDVFTAHWISD